MIPRRLATIAFLAAVPCLSAGSIASAQTDVHATLQHGGLTRTYVVRLPPGFSTGQRRPLVLALHPAFSSGPNFKASCGWDAVSDAHGCVVVYPNGGSPVGTSGNFTWNSWEFSGAAPDDVGFLSALIDQLHAEYETDPCRTYMTGFSNGAMMTNSFVAVHAERVAAIAPVSGGWITAYGGSESELEPSRALPTWIWRGSNENFVTGVGKSARTRGQQDLEQRDFWVTHNAATLVETVTEQLTYGITRTYVTSIFEGDAPVRFTEVQGTGHVYQPGAADLVWNRFFAPIESESGPCAPCPADLDGNGATGSIDLAMLLGAWGTAGSNADLDGNGTVGASDLAMLLAAWGPC